MASIAAAKHGEHVMMRRLALLFCLLLLALGPLTALLAQQKPKRVALVIGNDKYLGSEANPKGLAPLENPVRDARAVAELLRKHKFDEVLDSHDVDHNKFTQLIRRFSRLAEGADTALVFYAGHGMEVVEKGDYYNVLAPTDAEIDCDRREHDNTIRLDEIMKATRGAANQIIILDACRNNPFPRCRSKRGEAARGGGFRSAELKTQVNETILLAYSTAQKSVADDGKPGEHSPFDGKALWPALGQGADRRLTLLPLLFGHALHSLLDLAWRRSSHPMNFISSARRNSGP
jgi:Caspase domain